MIHRLYTWLDIRASLEAADQGPAPLGISGIEYFFDSLVVSVARTEDVLEARRYLADVFPERYHNDQIDLDGSSERQVTVSFEVGAQTVPKLRPLFGRTDLRLFPDRRTVPPPLANDAPPIVAFHSFKGGVGRTTHLLAFLKAATERHADVRPLIIDADLEAPGITWLLEADRLGVPEMSLIDCLALWQSDYGFDRLMSRKLIAERLQFQTITLPGHRAPIVYLPAFRYSQQLLTDYVRPEQLIAAPGDEWTFAKLIGDLATAVRSDLVLVDLRAGISEIAGPLLFDSRVSRVLVSTSSPQSVRGTSFILRLMREHDSNDLRLTPPEILLTFSTPELQTAGIYAQAEEELIRQLPIGSDTTTEIANPVSVEISDTPFVASLQHVGTLSEAFNRVKEGGLVEALSAMVDRLLPASATTQPETASRLTSMAERRDRLADLAKSYEYAESGRGSRFLVTPQLSALAQSFDRESPQVVVLGAKGSGKTYTYLQIARQKEWHTFVRELASDEVGLSYVWPALQSSSLRDEALQTVRQCVADTAASSDLPGSQDTISQARANLLRRLSDPGTVIDQRDHWFTFFAESLGFNLRNSDDPAQELFTIIRSKGIRIAFIVDGLEDSFQDINVLPEQRTAVRALLQEVMLRLRSTPDSPIGVVTFVRADIARTAISQNFGQFSKQYERFELRWDHEQALRLVYWLATEANALDHDASLHSENTESLSEKELRDLLVPLWGAKLGPPKSREARTAEWVIAALSDFNGRIQARDLVRLVRQATQETLQQTPPPPDRLLSPASIRSAVTYCSREKIVEIEEEVGGLKPLFAKLRDNGDRKIPLDVVSLGLNRDEVDFLTSNGVLREDRGAYFMPEIFRLGLGYRLEAGARPRVLSMARRSGRGSANGAGS